MIDIKTRLHDEKSKIAEATEECKEKIEQIEVNIQTLTQQNQQMKKDIDDQKHLGGAENISKDNIETLVSCQDPFSEKIVNLVAKYKALDDCMSAVQKGFEKDAINLPDFLQSIRKLSGKQFKQLHKMGKINEKMCGAHQHVPFTGY